MPGGRSRKMFTDRTGKFRFFGLAPAQYTVVVSSPGFKSVQQHVDLQTASSSYVVLQLVPDDSFRALHRQASPGVTDGCGSRRSSKRVRTGQRGDAEIGFRQV